MRKLAVLLGAILVVFTFNLSAQVNPNYSLPQTPFAQDVATPAAQADAMPMFALAAQPELGAIGSTRIADPGTSASSSQPAEAQEVPSVYGVFHQYNWQIYAGYSFFRFYIVGKPQVTENMNGLDLGIVYYIPKFTWIGAEGQMVAEFGSLFGNSSHFGLGAGGPRFRWSAPRGIELWAHGLAGYSKLLPQTAFGNQSAFGFEAGGGVDVAAHHQRFAYRAEADAVGTRYFGTYQISPRIAAGIVFKF